VQLLEAALGGESLENARVHGVHPGVDFMVGHAMPAVFQVLRMLRTRSGNMLLDSIERSCN
jgi:hypothetical protein